MAENVIDAGAVLDERDRGLAQEEPEIEGTRGKALLAGARRQWPVGARTLFVVTGLVAAGFATALVLKARSTRQESEARERDKPGASERIERRVPPLKLAAVEAQGPRAQVREPGRAGAVLREEAVASSEADVLQRRLSRGFASGEGQGSEEQVQAAPREPSPSPESPPGKSSPLEEKLEAVELRAASAGILPDRDHLLTQGAVLDCVLETKMVSTVAGMTSCHLTRDVYGTSGRVVLLDRGSRVVGRFQGGMQQGDGRIFVVWTRVETPAGVVVELGSPGTGPLGEAGLGGHVDTRFWDRFGAAILLSIIENAADAAAARAAGTSQGTGINVGNTTSAGKEVVARSLEPTISIPPTLVKHQGERVGIFVARDLDFRRVYGLKRVARFER